MAAAERIGRGRSGGDLRPLGGGDETPDNAGEVPAGADPFDFDARLDAAGDRDAGAVAGARDVESDRRPFARDRDGSPRGSGRGAVTGSGAAPA